MGLELDTGIKSFPFNCGKVWTFKDSKNVDRIGVIPEEHDRFNKDISNQQVFGVDGKKTFNLQMLLDKIPSIDIREYRQETRLDLVLSLLDCFKRGFTDGENAAKEFKTARELKCYAQLLTEDLKNISNVAEWKSIANDMYGLLGDDVFTFDDAKKWILGFSYAIYYRLLGTKTTNIYKLPFPQAYNMKGNGFDGWDGSINLLNNFGGDNKFMSFISPAFNLTTTPIWRGTSGGEGINIDLTINLFNDTLEKSINNYVFVNTLISQNMPLQYAVLAQAPCLYDIKINGCGRLFMCSGNFDCAYKGVLRSPPKEFYKKIKTKINNSSVTPDNLYKLMKENDIVKIPDVYEIQMQFKSLLPNNFNNFLMQFSSKNKILTNGDLNQTQKGIIDTSGGKIVGSISSWAKGKIGPAKTKAFQEETYEKYKGIYHQDNLEKFNSTG